MMTACVIAVLLVIMNAAAIAVLLVMMTAAVIADILVMMTAAAVESLTAADANSIIIDVNSIMPSIQSKPFMKWLMTT